MRYVRGFEREKERERDKRLRTSKDPAFDIELRVSGLRIVRCVAPEEPCDPPAAAKLCYYGSWCRDRQHHTRARMSDERQLMELEYKRAD